jgi:hypothetical protein
MYVFKNLTDILTFKKIRVVYQALIKFIINYDISIWGGLGGTYMKQPIDPLKKIQNKILFLNNIHYSKNRLEIPHKMLIR